MLCRQCWNLAVSCGSTAVQCSDVGIVESCCGCTMAVCTGWLSHHNPTLPPDEIILRISNSHLMVAIPTSLKVPSS